MKCLIKIKMEFWGLIRSNSFWCCCYRGIKWEMKMLVRYLLWQKLKRIIPFLSRNFTPSMMYGRLYLSKMQQTNDFLFYLPKFIIRFYKNYYSVLLGKSNSHCEEFMAKSVYSDEIHVKRSFWFIVHNCTVYSAVKHNFIKC